MLNDDHTITLHYGGSVIRYRFTFSRVYRDQLNFARLTVADRRYRKTEQRTRYAFIVAANSGSLSIQYMYTMYIIHVYMPPFTWIAII